MMFPLSACAFLILLSLSKGYAKDGYDYIVVGAGSAGATLAARLSEIETAKVLLIEAGGEPSEKSEIPLLALELQETYEDWNYTTEPQEFACQGFENKRCYYPRGKVLGGSSILNYMVYARGNKHDFDDWAEKGAKGWSFDELLPYFKKSEDIKITENIDPEFHGKNGELAVSYAGYETKLGKAYLEAGKALGYPTTDINGKNQLGFTPIQTTTKDGLRCSTEKAFLRPAYQRKNFHVVTNALVTKVDIQDKVARGVFYKVDGELRHATASKEVILSAGAINTPQLLMLSGVGPKEHLEDLGIDVVADLPVGHNLQDHVISWGVHYTIDTSDGIVLSRILKEKMTPGKGTSTICGGVETIGFVRTKYADGPADLPDIELVILSTLLLFPQHTPQLKEFLQPYLDRDTFSILAILMRPLSVGRVTLRSSNPEDKPVIYMPYLSNEHDRKVIVEGLKIAIELAETEPLKQFGAKPINHPFPGCESFKIKSDEYLACVAKLTATTVYHPLGTTKMGDPASSDTVVDPQLRVKGIRGLRVADTSVMPSMISGHTNAAAIMVGEKAADLIKEAYYKTVNQNKYDDEL